MKIPLIQPPIQDFYQTSIRTQPIGLAYLAASSKHMTTKWRFLIVQQARRDQSLCLPSFRTFRTIIPLMIEALSSSIPVITILE